MEGFKHIWNIVSIFLPFYSTVLPGILISSPGLQFLVALLKDPVMGAIVLFNWFSFVEEECDPRITQST